METSLNRRVDELTQDDISSLKREPRKRYRNIVNRICRIDDRVYQNRGRCELGATERIIDRIKKDDMEYVQAINDILTQSKNIVLNCDLYKEHKISEEDLKVIRLDTFTSGVFLTALHHMHAKPFIENPEVDLNKIKYNIEMIRNEKNDNMLEIIVNKVFAQVKESGILDLVSGVFKLIKERDLEELKRRTDILEEYLKLIGVWEEVFKPNYRHFSNVEYLKSNPRLMYELDLTHLVYCTQMMLIATHPSYDRVLRNRNQEQVNRMSW